MNQYFVKDPEELEQSSGGFVAPWLDVLDVGGICVRGVGDLESVRDRGGA